MKRPFEIIEHTADVGIMAYGRDLAELFANAALALFSLITDARSIEQKAQRKAEVSGKDTENLLVEWLNDLIYIFDVERMVFSRFDVSELTGTRLQAVCHGENLDPSKHRLKMGVKAATYHMLALDKERGIYRARVILDV